MGQGISAPAGRPAGDRSKTAGEAVLSPGLVQHHRDTVGKIHAALTLAHRQAYATFRGDIVQHRLGQAAGLRAENEGIPGLIIDAVVTLPATRRHAEPAWRPYRRQEVIEITVLQQLGILTVIQPGSTQPLVIELKSQGVDEVQTAA